MTHLLTSEDPFFESLLSGDVRDRHCRRRRALLPPGLSSSAQPADRRAASRHGQAPRRGGGAVGPTRRILVLLCCVIDQRLFVCSKHNVYQQLSHLIFKTVSAAALASSVCVVYRLP